MIPLSSFKNFSEAGEAVLKFLSAHLPFQIWMITRKEGNDWIVLQTQNQGYEIEPGRVFDWRDSFCCKMVEAGAPKMVTSSSQHPIYRGATIAKLIDIEAYIGEPIVQADGALFGTLCALDPQVKSEDIFKHASLVTLLGKLLSNILQAELREQEQIRRGERLELQALTDHLTGLLNRRAWDQLLDCEEKRCQSYGHPACVVMIDLNDLKITNDQLGHRAGDELIQKTASSLKSSLREHDVIARLGGDEFGILLTQTRLATAQTILQRIITKLQDEGVQAAVGSSMRHPQATLFDAVQEADQHMYQNKQNMKKASM